MNPDADAPFVYHAFISYRHADNQKDGRKWADWLHQTLEGYEVPEDIANTDGDHGPVPRSLYPIFQDEKSLRASSGLNEALQKALGESRFLIVLCSPAAAESTYVCDEIRHFKKLGRSRRILALILSGEPNSADPVSECFPEPLRFGLGEDGELDYTKPEQPIAADVRIDGTGEGFTNVNAAISAAERGESAPVPAGYAEQLDRARLKVIAALLGVGLEDLTRRDKAYELLKARKRARTL
ncbi:MAG TPA: toll/interleukin-1 receptor domain-containing protein, partial [Luteolibacter sp.]|nr:toll/interleukin-1 receptor domain-containing protein [Luteolibacter sp.]